MTTVYFIRHAEPDLSVHDDFSRPLSLKGIHDCTRVSDFLQDKNIQVALSSPYRRAVDTILPFASSVNLEIEPIIDFRERAVTDAWIEDFTAFTRQQWADFSYKLPRGECLFEVQQRNVDALKKILTQHSGANMIIGTHGTALSTIINYYDKNYGYEDFQAIANIFPWVVKMVFDEQNCVKIEQVDLFA